MERLGEGHGEADKVRRSVGSQVGGEKHFNSSERDEWDKKKDLPSPRLTVRKRGEESERD